MSKVYEALLHARAEKLHTEIPKPETHPQKNPFINVAATSATTIATEFEREMIVLDQSISDLTKHTKNTFIQFMGLHGGEGTSSIVRALAKIGLGKKRQSTLIVDVHRHQPLFQHFSLTPRPSLVQSMYMNWDLNEAIQNIGDTRLFISSLYSNRNGGTDNHSQVVEKNTFEQLRQQFDVILLDAPPVCTSVDGLSLCNQVDGVILVVEAEKSKAVVIEHAKNRIAQSGGTLYGIVFNKQRHYIPDWAYRWL